MKNEELVRAGLWGVLVADAMGVPHEFKAPVTVPVDMVMPPSYPKTYSKVPYGTWSDDGALTLALAASLTQSGGVDLHDVLFKSVTWMTEGAFTPDGHRFDIGNTTQEALLRFMRGRPAQDCGLRSERSNGNGSLMRTLPLALFHNGSDEELYADAGRISATTHAHDFAKAACGVYCVAARHLLKGAAVSQAITDAMKLAHVKLDLPGLPGGSGYVLDSLAFAFQALRSGRTYEQVVVDAIRLGADTDTTAAIAGGLVAVRDGMDAIPERWLKAMRGVEVATPIIESFVLVACRA